MINAIPRLGAAACGCALRTYTYSLIILRSRTRRWGEIIIISFSLRSTCIKDSERYLLIVEMSRKRAARTGADPAGEHLFGTFRILRA